MSKRTYWVVLITILLFGVVLRIAPVLDNNFHFTMDQGDDAVNVRDIIERHQVVLHGPETNIANLYSGALWYYFLIPGFLVTQGNPSAVIYLLILLSLAATIALVLRIKKKVSLTASLVVALGLQFFWWHYDISRYGFNPFPLVPLAIFTFLLIEDFWEKPKRQLTLAALTVGLAFHTELAGAMALFIFYCTCVLFFLLRRKLNLKGLVAPILVFALLLLPFLLQEIKNDFLGFYAVQDQIFGSHGVFNDNRYLRLTVNLLKNISDSAVPQNSTLGLLTGLTIFGLFLRTKAYLKNKFALRFAILTIVFVVINFLWFGSNTGWDAWHTVSIPTLSFISILLLAYSLPYFFRISFIVLIMTAQLSYFQSLYRHFIQPLGDESILKNELASIDWIYSKSQSQGFYVYNYLPSVRDYSHQYLFWWWGRKQYGYVPCEYSRYPGVPDFFVPGYYYYQNIKHPCSSLRFLIIEPNNNSTIFQQWYEGVTRGSRLVESTQIGRIHVEERQNNK